MNTEHECYLSNVSTQPSSQGRCLKSCAYRVHISKEPVENHNVITKSHEKVYLPQESPNPAS